MRNGCFRTGRRLVRRLAFIGLHLASLLVVTSCGQNRVTGTHTEAIFKRLDLRLMDEPTARQAAPMLGALLVQIPDPEQPGQTFSLPACTGIQIGRRYVLTAAHCDRPSGYIFSKNRIAAPSSLGAITVYTAAPQLRLIFDGVMIDAEARDEKQTPTSKPAIFKSTALDAAIIAFDYDLPQGSLNLKKLSSDISSLAHFGYPNGLPLAASYDCSGVSIPGSARFHHDCDSLTGSSGGLLVDSHTGRPVGMQLAAPGYNLSAFYLATGHFESAADFAARRGCQASAFPDPVQLEACISERGFNTAVRLSVILDEVRTKQPDLYAKLMAETPDK